MYKYRKKQVLAMKLAMGCAILGCALIVIIFLSHTTLSMQISDIKANTGLKDIVKDNTDSVVGLMENINGINYVTGTGFVIRNDGYILTAKHCLHDPTPVIGIYLKDGTKIPIDSSKTIPIENRDLAFIKVDYNLTPLEIENADTVIIGSPVVFIGYPIHTSPTQIMNEGVIAQKGIINNVDSIAIDSYANYGDSGSPLISQENGKVVGVLVSILYPTQEASNPIIIPENISDETKLILQSQNKLDADLTNKINRDIFSGLNQALPINSSILNVLPTL